MGRGISCKDRIVLNECADEIYRLSGAAGPDQIHMLMKICRNYAQEQKIFLSVCRGIRLIHIPRALPPVLSRWDVLMKICPPKKESEANETLDPMWVDSSIPHSALKEGKKRKTKSALFMSLGIPCSCACLELDLCTMYCTMGSKVQRCRWRHLVVANPFFASIQILLQQLRILRICRSY